MRQRHPLEQVSGAPRLGAGDDDKISISLIGPVCANVRGRPLDLRLRKADAILGFLCLQDRMIASRERLADLLWSGQDEQRARTSLRQTLAQLRRSFDAARFGGLVTRKLDVSLQCDKIDVDVHRVLHQADRFQVDPLLLTTLRLPERVLEGLEDLDDEFRSWLMPLRQAIHNRLERSLNSALSQKGIGAADIFKIATALLALDPTNENACRHLMEAHVGWGDASGALRAYEQLSMILARDHGLKPSAETQALVERIRRTALGERIPLAGGGSRSARPANKEPRRRPPSADQPKLQKSEATIALRLGRFGAEGVPVDRAYLISGFRHELIASLIRFREWSLIESEGVPGAAKDRLRASEYRLEGTAYQTGPTINMALTLIDSAQSIYVWSEGFELTLDGWFETQRSLIRRLSSSLNVHLSAERLKRVSDQPDVSLRTYDQWLRAQSLLTTFRASDWQRARGLLAAAREHSPRFAPLYSSAVQMNNVENLVFPGVLRRKDAADSTVVLAKRAVQLDPVDSRSHLCLGWALALAQRFDAAAPHMQLARELNNNDPWTTLSSAAFWAYSGERDRARDLLEKSLTNSAAFQPHSWMYCAIIRFFDEQYESALIAFDRAQNVTRAIPAWRAAALANLGRLDEAKIAYREFVEGVRKAWSATERPTEPAIARWLLQAHPIRRREDWLLMKRGIERAGVVMSGVEHQIW